MPFSLISTALGLCFVLMWLLIAVMIFRDGQSAVRSERELQNPGSPTSPRHVALPHPHWARYGDLHAGQPMVENA